MFDIIPLMISSQKKYILQKISNQLLPPSNTISSVHAIIFHGSKIVVIKNKRGWDIPGGHIEKNETPTKALLREIEEEAGLIIDQPLDFIVSLSAGVKNQKYADKKILFAISKTQSIPQKGRLMAIPDFLLKYSQNTFKDMMQKILEIAEAYEI